MDHWPRPLRSCEIKWITNLDANGSMSNRDGLVDHSKLVVVIRVKQENDQVFLDLSQVTAKLFASHGKLFEAHGNS
jgi:hypothetical protein